MSRISISVRATEDEARTAITALIGFSPGTPGAALCSKLQRAVARTSRPSARQQRPHPLSTNLRRRAPSKEEKRKSRASIRERVFARSGGRCEGPAESDPRNDGRCLREPTELLHVFGRGRGRMPESEQNCLAACGTCHRAETRNKPDSKSWWTYFGNLFARNGWTAESREARKRAAFDEVRASLPAAPKIRR